VGSSTFIDKSETNHEVDYKVRWDKKRWTCSCEDFEKHRKKCKHIYAVCYYLSLQDLQIGVRKIGQDTAECPKCGLSEFVIKDGLSESRSGLGQRFFCKKCNHGFSPRTGFEGVHGQAFAIVLSLDLYYRGLSLRQISEHFQSVYGIKISHGTIYGWIKRYVELVCQYLNKVKVKTGERWHADETVLRVKGKHLVLWSMLDDEYRQLIAQHISGSKSSEEAGKLLEEGLSKTKKQPMEIITDAAPSYAEAIDRKFGKELKQPLIHVQTSISTPLSNNKIERFNKTIKQRFKPIGSFHSPETARTFSKGFKIFYNEIKNHRSLGGRAPSKASNPKNDQENWAKLIRKASK
jgi:transposase-like protein